MAVLDARQRTGGYLLLAVMVGHIVLISVQVNRRSGVLESFMFGVLSEIQRTGALPIRGVRDLWANYVDLRDARIENEALRRQNEELQIQLQQQHTLILEARRLQELLELRQELGIPTIAAHVIASDPTPWFRTVTIDRGAIHGVRRDMAVVAAAGAVGRVVGEPGPRAAKVQLLIDLDAAAGAMIERSRAGGIVIGSEGDPPLRMDYVSNLADVQIGDLVVTSGIDGIYPKGFPIGRVEFAERGLGLYKTIRIRPVADFSALEAVLVVMTPPGPDLEDVP